jgi:hypothetical protein
VLGPSIKSGSQCSVCEIDNMAQRRCRQVHPAGAKLQGSIPRRAGGGLTSGAPRAWRVVSTRLTGSLLRPMRVVSFPSLQVPAPPSPEAGEGREERNGRCQWGKGAA